MYIASALPVTLSIASDPDAFDSLGGHLTYPDLEHYLASSVVLVNVSSMTTMKTIHLELTKVSWINIYIVRVHLF